MSPINVASISMILRSLAGAVTMPGIFGEGAAKLSPVLNTLGALAEVPAELEPVRQQLLDQVQTWVNENRGPTDAELDQFKATRDELDERARKDLAALDAPAPTPPPSSPT